MGAVGKSRQPSGLKKPSEMDQYIGGRLRLWRRTMDVDASHLAERVGVTYQQLQKYEKGVNRISATRLYAISRELDVPIDYFYQDAEPPRSEPTVAPDPTVQGIDHHALLSNGSGTDFLRCFVSIKDPVVRKALIRLMRSLMAENNSEPEE
jgi:transcriptional regulator with XRE-family HTH domain